MNSQGIVLKSVIKCRIFLDFQGFCSMNVLNRVIGYYGSLRTIRVKIRVQICLVFTVGSRRGLYQTAAMDREIVHCCFFMLKMVRPC